jgi:hypothetical protein
MVKFMKGNIKKIEEMEWENINFKVEIFIMENGKTVKDKEKDRIII